MLVYSPFFVSLLALVPLYSLPVRWTPQKLQTSCWRKLRCCGSNLGGPQTPTSRNISSICGKVDVDEDDVIFMLVMLMIRTQLKMIQTRVWRIFGYSNIFKYFPIRIFICIILVWFFFIRIYSNIRSYDVFDTNIFGYLFVSIFRTQTDSDDVFV